MAGGLSNVYRVRLDSEEDLPIEPLSVGVEPVLEGPKIARVGNRAMRLTLAHTFRRVSSHLPQIT